ncbi:MAG TPA: ABC transporter permease, partial [Candidatus Angelobacter sp.]|nr:ABC transporter permease [Candidatus Angelobacter sp.]
MSGWQKGGDQPPEEIETRVEAGTDQNVHAGMPPEHARREAKPKFGNIPPAATQSRRVWSAVWLENLLRDVRYAARSLSTVPGYTTTLACTLALGLGCVTAMLAIVQSVLLRPVNLPHPDRLVEIYTQNGSKGFSAGLGAMSYASIEALRRGAHSFTGVSGYNTMVQPVVTAYGARVDLLMDVTSGFFQTLGVSAKFGRAIGPDNATAPVVVVSDNFWRERLNANPKAIGTAITIAGKQWTVIGILPAGFQAPGTTGAPVVFVPASVDSSGQDEFKMQSATVIARLRSGVTMQQARDEVQSVLLHAAGTGEEKQKSLTMRSYQELITGDMQQPLWALLGAAMLLLLIACANAANLQIGRTASRMPEMTIRSALGAGLGRLVQQLVTENVLVSLFGAVLGTGLAFIAVAVARHAYAGKYPRFDELKIHPSVLCAVCMLAMTVGVIVSLAPALGVYRRTAGRFASRSATRKSRLSGLLVATQVALTCVLLVT